VSKRSGLSRGDARRNARLGRLRAIVRADRAILAIDLADDRQEVAVCDHDSRVLARRSVRGRAWELEQALGWGVAAAATHGFAGLVVACEPTGHRWRIVVQLADQQHLPVVCVQPLLVHRAREHEDLTRDKSDPKDAVLIARLVAGLHCYLPERPEPAWARLRHLGARRVTLLTQATAARQQLRDLLECACPGLLDAAADPLGSLTWRAAVAVALPRAATVTATATATATASGPDGDRYDRFAAQVAGELGRWGGQRRCHRILRAVWAAIHGDTGVATHRRGALERASLVLDDWHDRLARMAEVQTRMTGLLDELGLGNLVTSIQGLSVVGAAAILAETGDPARYDSGRCLVKHAGLAPRDNTSGRFAGTTQISGRGRPLLRAAAWRAVWGALPHNPVLAARYQHLTTRDHNRLTDPQARAALAAALLRWLWQVCVRRVTWRPELASGTLDARQHPAA
jgi:transposase